MSDKKNLHKKTQKKKKKLKQEKKHENMKKNLPHKRMLSIVNKKGSKLQPTKSKRKEFKY